MRLKKSSRFICLLFVGIYFLAFSVSGAGEIPPKVAISEMAEWYAVESWEIEVCSYWGGLETPVKAGFSATPVSISQTTIALQGEVRRESVGNFSQNLYSVSWYFQPLFAAKVSIVLVGDIIEFPLLNETIVSPTIPTASFFTFYVPENYYKVILTWESLSGGGSGQGSNVVVVPLVEIENE